MSAMPPPPSQPRCGHSALLLKGELRDSVCSAKKPTKKKEEDEVRHV